MLCFPIIALGTTLLQIIKETEFCYGSDSVFIYDSVFIHDSRRNTGQLSAPLQTSEALIASFDCFLVSLVALSVMSLIIPCL